MPSSLSPTVASRRPRRLAALVAVAVLGALLAACSSSAETSTATSTAPAGAGGTAPAADAFPVAIPHAFGETTIEAEPTRVVTWGWGSTDAAIALGVVPVAMPYQAYAGDDEGVLPWIREALDEQGEALPTVLPDAEDPPFEAIAAASPDVILAPYSGITDSDYELLTQIAPTVAYPEEAWATPWRDTIEIVGAALGRSEQAADLLADIDAQVTEQADAHPELAGKTVAMVWPDVGETSVYKSADSRVTFAQDLGLVIAPSVETLSSGEETFYYQLSNERLGELSSDILVAFASTPEQAAQFRDAPEAQVMDQVRRGAVAQVVGPQFISAVSPPTALSLTWGLADYVELLATAAAAPAAS